MPRHTQRRSRRARVRSSDAPITTGVFAPSVVNARSGIGDTADAFSRILGARTQQRITEGFERRRQKAFLEGTRAAIEGRELTPEEAAEDARRLGYMRVRTERALIEDRNELVQKYLAEFDKETGTPDELNAFIDEFFQERYAGLDPESDVDEILGAGLADNLEGIRRELLEDFSADLRERQQDEIEGDLYAIARDDFGADGEIDFKELHERMLPTLGGSRANELLVSIAADVAISQGRPDIIDNLPAQWPDGTPGPKNVKRLADTVRNARISAENQRRHQERLAESQGEAELREQREAAEVNVMLGILEGREVSVQVSNLLQDGLLSPEAGRTLLKFQDAQADNFSAGTVNDSVAADLEVKLYTGEADVTDVIEAAGEGRLGSGRAVKSELTRLLSLAGSVRTIAEQRLSTPEAKRFEKEISSLLTPAKDAFGNPKPIELQTQATALREYNERVANGESPAEARNAVLEEAARRRQVTQQATSEARQDSPEELLRLLEQGAISDTEFDRRMSALEAGL